MANFDDTYVAQWILGRADRYNKTLSVPGGVRLGLEMTAANMAPLPDSQVQGAIKDFSNKPQIAIIDDAGTLRIERSVMGYTPAIGTTKKAELTRATYEYAFTVSPTLLAANAVTADEYTNAMFEKGVAKMLKAIEADVITFIAANRTKKNPSVWPFAFNETTDTIEVENLTGATLEDEMKVVERSLTYAPGFLENAGFPSAIAILGSTSLRGVIKETSYFGMNNSRDLSNILEGAKAYYSSEIAVGSGVPAITNKYYVFAPESFGMYTWISPEAKGGVTNGAASIGSQFIPGLGFDVEFYREGTFANQSAIAGGSKLTNTVVYRMMVDVVLAATNVSNNTTQPLPIVEVTVTAPPAA